MPKRKKKPVPPRPTVSRSDVERLYEMLPRMARAAEQLLPAYDAAEMPPWLPAALWDLTTMTLECAMLMARLRHPAAGEPVPILERIYADLGQLFGAENLPPMPPAVRVAAPSVN